MTFIPKAEQAAHIPDLQRQLKDAHREQRAKLERQLGEVYTAILDGEAYTTEEAQTLCDHLRSAADIGLTLGPAFSLFAKEAALRMSELESVLWHRRRREAQAIPSGPIKRGPLNETATLTPERRPGGGLMA